MTYPAWWPKKAKIFLLKQRAEELERANKRVPNSPRRDARNQELHDIYLELKELENE